MNPERVKHKLSAILRADVKGYSRPAGENEVATVWSLKERADRYAKKKTA